MFSRPSAHTTSKMIFLVSILVCGCCVNVASGDANDERAALGIDVGTEFVRAVAFNGAAPRLFEAVEDADGELRQSSAVGSHAGERLVGSDALHLAKKKPEKVMLPVDRVTFA